MKTAKIVEFPETETDARSIAEPRKVRICGLHLRKFKGSEGAHLNLGFADSVTIYGRNEAGKTTLADAWCWLVTGKDSLRRGDAEIKTLRRSGEPLHNCEHGVQADVSIGVSSISLKRTLAEKWTKKRGSRSPEMTGHVTTYEVDGVPVSEREYKERTAALLAPEREFWLLTDPAYFCAGLPWQERRRLLLEVCGDVSDAEVIASDPELERLPTVLGGKSLDEFRAVAKASLKKANDELDVLPARLDEAQRAVNGAEDLDEDALADQMRLAQDALDEARQRRDALAYDPAADMRGKLANVDRAISQLRSQREDDDRLEKTRRQRALTDAQAVEARVVSDLKRVASERERLVASILALEGKIATKRAEWHAAHGEPAEIAAVADACAACGQRLPADRVAAAREKAQEATNVARAERLAAIQEAGQALARTRDAERERLETCGDTSSCERAVEAARAATATARQASETAVASEPTARELELRAEAESLRAKLASQEPNADAAEAAEAVKAAERRLGELQGRQAVLVANQRANDRVAELRNRQLMLGDDADRLMAQLDLCDRFVIAKVNLLESRIAREFGGPKFRMFERQINGGIAECCDVTFQGVPYSDLNHAAKVNVGLACVGVLQRHFGVALPIWVDGRESVTDLVPTAAQTISLVVSPQDETLRIELGE